MTKASIYFMYLAEAKNKAQFNKKDENNYLHMSSKCFKGSWRFPRKRPQQSPTLVKLEAHRL